MFWQLKLIEDGFILLPEKPEDYDQHPEKYLLKINLKEDNQYFQKVFSPDPEGNLLVKEQLVIEEKLNEKVESKETKPKEQQSEEKLDSNEIKVMFRDLKADVQKKIDKTVSEINERFEKIENQVHDIQTMQPIPQKSEPSRKLPRLVIGLIALISFLIPSKSLHEPKIEPPKIEKKQVSSPPRSKVTKKKSAGPITALKEMWKLIGRTLQ